MVSITSIPQFTPMPLGHISELFDYPDWVFQIKHDGFRALAYMDDACTLVSRKAHTSSSRSCQRVSAQSVFSPAALDGEIVCLDDNGRPQFND
jgi:bifunctional non-homologous end joining protein LigD